MIRIATYNVAWFDQLFDDGGALRADDGDSGLQDVSRAARTAALVAVFGALDADAVLIVEAPDQSHRRDCVRALESFARHAGLRACRALTGFATDTQQEIALLFDPDRLQARHDPQGAATGRKGHRKAPRFDGVFRVDLDGDGREDLMTWSKPPLEIAARTAGGVALRLIGVHAKSKAPHGARSQVDATRLSIANRRKQLAQCLWLRARVDQHLAQGDSVMVLGDFNDGPGLDAYEQVFGRSGVEIVLGSGATALLDPHVQMALTRRFAAPPTTARFRHGDAGWQQYLLDYIMISADLAATGPRWRIWHPFDDPVCFADHALRDALLSASDHFPVTLDIAI